MKDSNYYMLLCDANRRDLLVAEDIDPGDLDWRKITYGRKIDFAVPNSIRMTVSNGMAGDLVGNKYGWTIVSEKLYYLLRDALSDNVQWIPLLTTRKDQIALEIKYYILHPIKFYDVIHPTGARETLFTLTINSFSVPDNALCFRLLNREYDIVYTKSCIRLITNHNLNGIEYFPIKSIAT